VGRVAAVAKITGVSRKRIIAGLKDLAAPGVDVLELRVSIGMARVAFVAREAVAVRSPSRTSNTLSSR
jgi:hypothetical protein